MTAFLCVTVLQPCRHNRVATMQQSASHSAHPASAGCHPRVIAARKTVLNSDTYTHTCQPSHSASTACTVGRATHGAAGPQRGPGSLPARPTARAVGQCDPQNIHYSPLSTRHWPAGGRTPGGCLAADAHARAHALRVEAADGLRRAHVAGQPHVGDASWCWEGRKAGVHGKGVAVRVCHVNHARRCIQPPPDVPARKPIANILLRGSCLSYRTCANRQLQTAHVFL